MAQNLGKLFKVEPPKLPNGATNTDHSYYEIQDLEAATNITNIQTIIEGLEGDITELQELLSGTQLRISYITKSDLLAKIDNYNTHSQIDGYSPYYTAEELAQDLHTIWLVPQESGGDGDNTDHNTKDEWLLKDTPTTVGNVTSHNVVGEIIGTTEADLSGFSEVGHTHDIKIDKHQVGGTYNVSGASLSQTPTATSEAGSHSHTIGSATKTKIKISTASLSISADTGDFANGSLTTLTSGNDSNAVFNDISVSDGVMSFVRKQLATSEALTEGSTITGSASVVEIGSGLSSGTDVVTDIPSSTGSDGAHTHNYDKASINSAGSITFSQTLSHTQVSDKLDGYDMLTTLGDDGSSGGGGGGGDTPTETDNIAKALIAYEICSTSGSGTSKEVNIPYYSQYDGGSIKIKFLNANTASGGGVYLRIMNGSTQLFTAPLLYNGLAVSDTNTWKDNEVVDVYFNGVSFEAYPVYNSRALETELYDSFAQKDGSYEQMSVGLAKNLEGTESVSGKFMERTSGGEAEISTGVAQLTGIEGNSNQWNQMAQSDNRTMWDSVTLVTNADGSYTLNGTKQNSVPVYNLFSLGEGEYPGRANHRFLLWYKVKSGTGNLLLFDGYLGNISTVSAEHPIRIYKCRDDEFFTIMPDAVSETEVFDNLTFNFSFIDLTLMFGSDAQICSKLGITQSELTEGGEAACNAFEQWLSDNVGLRAYYSYDPGSLLSVKMSGISSVGYNLLNPTTHTAHLIGEYDNLYDNLYGIKGTYTSISYTDVLGNTYTPTISSDGTFTVQEAGELTVNGAGDDCRVFLWWDGTKTEYEPYKKETKQIDTTGWTGINSSTGARETIFPDGLKGIGDIKDRIYIDNDGTTKATKYFGSVDLGSLNYELSVMGDYQPCYRTSEITDIKRTGPSTNLVCQSPKFVGSCMNALGWVTDFGIVVTYDGVGDYLTRFQGAGNDPYNSDASTFKTAMSGVYLYYELATPVQYTSLQDASGNPLEFPIQFWSDNWGIEQIEPQNTATVTNIAPTIEAQYSMDAVEAIRTLQDESESLQTSLDTKANTDGNYPDMSVGTAKNLEGKQITSDPFVFRTTGGEIDLSDGNGSLEKIEGNTVSWNQLASNTLIKTYSGTGEEYDTGKYYSSMWWLDADATPIIVGHKFFIKSSIKNFTSNLDRIDINVRGVVLHLDQSTTSNSVIGVAGSDAYNFGRIYLEGSAVWSVDVTSINIIDLTLLGIDYMTTADQVEEWLSANVGSKSYYPYNPGELISYCGKSVKWNQLVQNGDFSDGVGIWAENNASILVGSQGATITLLSEYSNITQAVLFTQGHKYYIYTFAKSGSSEIFLSNDSSNLGILDKVNEWAKYNSIYTHSGQTGNNQFRIISSSPSSVSCDVKSVIIIDLTLMFGAGSEPDLDTCKSIFTSDYYPYDSGTTKNLFTASNTNTGLMNVGFNQWDEEWEVGVYSQATGEATSFSDRIRSKNFISVFGGVTYFVKCPVQLVILSYDANKNYLGPDSVNYITNEAFTIPTNASFIRFYTGSNLTTYNHDICINLSWDGSRNGEYEAYWNDILETNVPFITGIPDSVSDGAGGTRPGTEEDRTVIFPNGMRGVGTARDMIYTENGVCKAKVVMGEVDLGSLEWRIVEGGSEYGTVFVSSMDNLANRYKGACTKYPLQQSNILYDKTIATYYLWNTSEPTIWITDSSYSSAASFKSAMSGVMLVYELATPITYTNLKNPDGTAFSLPQNIKESNWGTEMILPQSGSSVLTAAPVLSMRYSIDAAETLDTLQNDGIMYYDLKDNFSSFLGALNQALSGIGSISISQNPTDKTYSFTFTPTT